MRQQDFAGKATGLDLLMRIAFCVYNASWFRCSCPEDTQLVYRQSAGLPKSSLKNRFLLVKQHGKYPSVSENRESLEFHYDTFTVIQTTAAVFNIYYQVIFPLQNSLFRNNS